MKDRINFEKIIEFSYVSMTGTFAIIILIYRSMSSESYGINYLS